MRRRRALFALLLPVLFLSSAQAQFVSVALDARGAAMGGCFLPSICEPNVAVSYRQGFMLTAMADKGLTAVLPTKRTGVAAVSYLHHGNTDYFEQQASVGYGIGILSWLMVGVEARYLNLGTSDAHYRPQHWLSAAARVRMTVGKRTLLSLSAGTRPWDDSHPYSLHLQMSHAPVKGLLAVVEGESEDKARLRLGIEYCMDEGISFRAGASSAPLAVTFGLGFRHRRFSIDLAAESHRSLGITPHTSLVLWF